jgi:hypothetical protein
MRADVTCASLETERGIDYLQRSTGIKHIALTEFHRMPSPVDSAATENDQHSLFAMLAPVETVVDRDQLAWAKSE